MKRGREKPKPKPVVKLGTVVNRAQAADLFATMLRSVEMEEQQAEENDNGRTGNDEKTPRR